MQSAGNYTVEAEKNRQKWRHWHNSSAAFHVCYPIFNDAMNADHMHLAIETSFDANETRRKTSSTSKLALHIFIISLFNFHCSPWLPPLLSQRSGRTIQLQKFQTTDQINNTLLWSMNKWMNKRTKWTWMNLKKWEFDTSFFNTRKKNKN